jgi:hypothetical protein
MKNHALYDKECDLRLKDYALKHLTQQKESEKNKNSKSIAE